MVNDMKRKKRQEKNFLTFFDSRLAVCRLFDKSSAPMSKDYESTAKGIFECRDGVFWVLHS